MINILDIYMLKTLNNYYGIEYYNPFKSGSHPSKLYLNLIFILELISVVIKT